MSAENRLMIVDHDEDQQREEKEEVGRGPHKPMSLEEVNVV